MKRNICRLTFFRNCFRAGKPSVESDNLYLKFWAKSIHDFQSLQHYLSHINKKYKNGEMTRQPYGQKRTNSITRTFEDYVRQLKNSPNS